mmetsp:Transcript_82304/g.266458  ORF Transcript_82304/g.266458 Transcript_82304/m.266458 type:complete len:299 (-) Transcript_82304:9-905(-)
MPAAEEPPQDPLLVAHARSGRTEAASRQPAAHLKAVLVVHGLPNVRAVVARVPFRILDQVYVLGPTLGAVVRAHVKEVSWQILRALRRALQSPGLDGLVHSHALGPGHGAVQAVRLAFRSTTPLGIDAARRLPRRRGGRAEGRRSRGHAECGKWVAGSQRTGHGARARSRRSLVLFLSRFLPKSTGGILQPHPEQAEKGRVDEIVQDRVQLSDICLLHGVHVARVRHVRQVRAILERGAEGAEGVGAAHERVAMERHRQGQSNRQGAAAAAGEKGILPHPAVPMQLRHRVTSSRMSDS